MIAEAVIDKMYSDSEITDLIKTIDPDIIKENPTYPASYVSDSSMESIGSFSDEGIKTGVIEIGIYADTYEQCNNAARKVRQKLDNFHGMVSNVAIRIGRAEMQPDAYDEQAGKHVKVIEYQAEAQIKE